MSRSNAQPALKPHWVRLVRDADPALPAPVELHGPADVAALLRPRAAQELVEVFYVISLDTRHHVIDIHEATRGLVDQSLVHPREAFRVAIANGAHSIVLAHNHPSGEPSPSGPDRTVTQQLVEAGELLGIAVVDHIILGAGKRYFSFAEAGLLDEGRTFYRAA